MTAIFVTSASKYFAIFVSISWILKTWFMNCFQLCFAGTFLYVTNLLVKLVQWSLKLFFRIFFRGSMKYIYLDAIIKIYYFLLH